jgi:LysM domain
MSAMRAEDLPAVPGALPQDSARTRAAARWTGPGQAAQSAPAPGHTAAAPGHTAAAPSHTAAAPSHTAAAPSPAVHPQSAHDQPARDQPATVPLRLTRRGRVVVAVAAALLLAALSLVIAVSAQATNHPVARAAQQNLTQVTVRPGQSLWSVAESADPGADTRAVIQQIVELNGLSGAVVFAGQRLWVPQG